MAYEMSSLLQKCEVPDFTFLIRQIDSYVNLTADAELNRLLADYEASKTSAEKDVLVQALEREIRYLGSTEAAYAWRKMTSKEGPAGVSIYEIIDDVAQKLKVKLKPLGSVEAKVERIVRAVVEKTFLSMTVAQQIELFDKAGVAGDKRSELMEKLKSNKAQFLPLLLSVVGPEVTKTIVLGLGTSALAAFIGRKAAEELIKNLVVRFPWWAEWLGPVVWGLSMGWLAIDLQGAAFRKTVPIMIYLGIVGLRDGPEDGQGFWSEH